MSGAATWGIRPVPSSENMKIENARIEFIDDRFPVLCFNWDGIPATVCEPRAALLEIGACSIQGGPPHIGVMPDSAELGIPEPRMMDELSNHPVLVEMVRRFAADDDPEAGPVGIPRVAESVAAKWDISITTGVFRKLQQRLQRLHAACCCEGDWLPVVAHRQAINLRPQARRRAFKQARFASQTTEVRLFEWSTSDLGANWR